MTVRTLLAPLLLLALAACTAAPSVSDRPDLARLFTEKGTAGTMVVVDADSQAAVVIDGARAARPYSPASTFKVANTLIALETGAVADIDGEVFPWDGTAFLVEGKRLLPKDCDADLTLRAAFKFSCIPVYQHLARRVGVDAYRHWLVELDYGNRDPGGGAVDAFWLTGALRTTAWDQVRFLQRLAKGDLPVSRHALAQVHDIMVVEANPDYTLRAKTGYAYAETPAVGWWVGWVERGGHVHVFALNLDVTRPDHLKARQEIGRAVLRDLGVI